MNKSLEEVKSDFEKQIIVPAQTLSRQVFFCPVGLVGAGKTTITKPIAEKLGLVRISSDELRKLLKDGGHSYDQLKTIGLDVVRGFADKGCSIAFDMDCGNPEIKKLIDTLAEKYNAKVFWVHLNTPEEHIFNKFRKHPPSWLADNPQTMIDNYMLQKIKREEEATIFDFFFTFDTSKQDVEEQIQNCIKLITNEIQ